MRTSAVRLRPALALIAWFAQLCLPVAHAVIMAAPHTEMLGWCGDPARARAAVAQLPAEIREALLADDTSADHLASCAELCATGSTSAPAPTLVASTVVLRAAGLELAPAVLPAPRSREQAPRPPSQGPPAHA
jgi:hypothetical protein